MGFTEPNHHKIDVRFFGMMEHDMSTVEINSCVLFSDNPNKDLDESECNQIDAAVMVFPSKRNQFNNEFLIYLFFNSNRRLKTTSKISRKSILVTLCDQKRM